MARGKCSLTWAPSHSLLPQLLYIFLLVSLLKHTSLLLSNALKECAYPIVLIAVFRHWSCTLLMRANLFLSWCSSWYLLLLLWLIERWKCTFQRLLVLMPKLKIAVGLHLKTSCAKLLLWAPCVEIATKLLIWSNVPLCNVLTLVWAFQLELTTLMHDGILLHHLQLHFLLIVLLKESRRWRMIFNCESLGCLH